MICPDAGSPLVVRVGEKGLIWVELSAAGARAHGAHVHKGVNAIDRLLRALLLLKGVEELPTHTPKEVQDVMAAARAVSEPLGGVGEHDTLQRLTVNTGTIRGGSSPNLVPDEAYAAADIRLPLGISTTDVIAHLHRVLDPLEGVSFKVTRRYEASWTSPSEDIVRYSLDAARSVVSPSAVPNMRVGASDSRLFRQRGIPTVVVGLTPHNMGGPDEYILTEELGQVAKIHALSAWQFLQPS
jgi:acetylornithine deacetylase/succinyl-diaminopimelate desuccinylase-like protein